MPGDHRQNHPEIVLLQPIIESSRTTKFDFLSNHQVQTVQWRAFLESVTRSRNHNFKWNYVKWVQIQFSCYSQSKSTGSIVSSALAIWKHPTGSIVDGPLCFDIGPIYRSLVQIAILQKYKTVIQGIEQGPPRFIEIKLLYKLEHHWYLLSILQFVCRHSIYKILSYHILTNTTSVKRPSNLHTLIIQHY